MAKLKFETRQRLHLDVRDRILRMLARGGARRGEALPTYRELSDRLAVSLVTVQRAMDLLVKDGVVEGWPGRGTFLARELAGAERRLTQLGLVFYGSRRLFFSSAYLMEIFQGIMTQAEDLAVDVRIFSIKNEGRIAVREIEASGVDGLLLLGVSNEAYLAEVARELLPLVVVDYRTSRVPADYVVTDNEAATRRCAEHLLGLGHRRIAYVDGYSTDTLQPGDPLVETSDVAERREAYRAAMREANLEARVCGIPGNDPHAGIAAAAKLAARGGATAFLAYDTAQARALHAALAQKGLRVPDDISIAAAAGASDALLGALTCTYSRVRFEAMGRRAVELLAERRRDGRPQEALTTAIGSDFVLGNTSAAPKGA